MMETKEQQIKNLIKSKGQEAVKSVAKMQKSPVNWEEIDNQVEEMFQQHNQVNPNKKNS